MSDLAARSGQLARRIMLAQVVATALVAAGFAFVGGRAALGAAMGGLAVMLGAVMLAWRTFSGAVSGADGALMRLLGGVALKWAVLAVMLYLALAVMALDPLAVVCGVLAALVANLVAMAFKN
ncbi:MAG: ATP synthase subunit I [Lysobacteraceae bacterium]